MSTETSTEVNEQLRELIDLRLAAGPVDVPDLVELGVYGAPLPEEFGGLGAGLSSALVIAEALGRARSTVPFVEDVVLAGSLIVALGRPAQQREWLPGIADGTLRTAVAFPTDGTPAPVLRAASADLVLIAARHDDGLSLHALAAADVAITSTFHVIDGTPAATVELSQGLADEDTLLGPAGGAAAAWEASVERAAAVQAAELTGIMSHLVEQTIAYLDSRRQFGDTLSRFQVARHKVVDMAIALEASRSLVAKVRLEDEHLATASRGALVAAAVVASRSARAVGHEAIQLHGGMGMTEELSIGPSLKRIYSLETRLGSLEHMADRYGTEVYR